MMKMLREEKRLLMESLVRTEMRSLEDKKIMVIDDCKDTLNLIKKYFEGIVSIDVHTFLDEHLAIRYFIRETPDLVILDMNLTKLDGIKVSLIMRNLSLFEVPIIFISQDGRSQYEIENFYGRKPLFLEKPFQKKPFISVVDELLSA